jgi:hypothetical protein
VRGLTADEAEILRDITDPVAAHHRCGGLTWDEHYRRVPILQTLTAHRRAEPNDRGGWKITTLGLLALRFSRSGASRVDL